VVTYCYIHNHTWRDGRDTQVILRMYTCQHYIHRVYTQCNLSVIYCLYVDLICSVLVRPERGTVQWVFLFPILPTPTQQSHCRSQTAPWNSHLPWENWNCQCRCRRVISMHNSCSSGPWSSECCRSFTAAHGFCCPTLCTICVEQIIKRNVSLCGLLSLWDYIVWRGQTVDTHSVIGLCLQL